MKYYLNESIKYILSEHFILNEAMKHSDLIAQGKGDLLVLMPNWTDEDNDGDYRSIRKIDSSDITDTYVYLCGNSAEEENKFWEEWRNT